MEFHSCKIANNAWQVRPSGNALSMDKLRAMKFFCRTVEAKSFAAAAHALDVAPSVLSKVISALEADLRFTLFNRSTRRLSLTEAGSTYYDHCRRLLVEMEEAESIARAGAVQPTGMLRVGIHPAIASCSFRSSETSSRQIPRSASKPY